MKSYMKKIPYVDLHQDIASNCLILTNKDFWAVNEIKEGFNTLNLPTNNQVDFFRLKKGHARMIFAASCSFSNKKGQAKNNVSLNTFRQINFYLKLVEKSNRKILLIKNWSDYLKLKSGLKMGFLLHVEGADFVDKNLVNLEIAYNLGVRSVGFTHNNKNHLAAGALDRSGGLKRVGRDALEFIRDKKMIMDLAHLNQKSMNDVLKIVEPPFMFSHGGLEDDLKHNRNLSRLQAKRIAERGGVIGVGFVPNLLFDNTIENVAKIFERLKKIAGVDSLAIGSDFDGIISQNLVKGLEDAAKMPALAGALGKRGFKSFEIEKVFYKNAESRLLRYLD